MRKTRKIQFRQEFYLIFTQEILNRDNKYV